MGAAVGFVLLVVAVGAALFVTRGRLVSHEPPHAEPLLEESRVLARIETAASSVNARFFRGGRAAVYEFNLNQARRSASRAVRPGTIPTPEVSS